MVRPWRFHLGAGALCLDFANTLSWRRSSDPTERVATTLDLIRWARQAGVISRRQEIELEGEAAAHGRRSARTLAAARSLREAIFAVFARISERHQPAAQDLRALEPWIRAARAQSRLVARGGRYRWALEAEVDHLDQVLWAIALSADELLASDQTRRIGQCSGRDCRWLWIDQTRNRSRRWCAMAVCGNRAKARRHYQRRRAGGDRSIEQPAG